MCKLFYCCDLKVCSYWEARTKEQLLLECGGFSRVFIGWSDFFLENEQYVKLCCQMNLHWKI